MFTGIIEEVGSVATVRTLATGARLVLGCRTILEDITTGASIDVNGVCLTAVEITREGFAADVSPETLRRSNLGDLRTGSAVNLERALSASGRLGGHLVQGHVDGTGTMTALDPVIPRSSPAFDEQTTDWTLRVRIPENVRKWMVPKGSVAVEGISLTIAGWDGEAITIAILPLTYWRTNLHTLIPGAPVNVEADVLVKLAYEQMVNNPSFQSPGLKSEPWDTRPSPFELTEAWLVANGF